jgi:hypothetical protein
MLVHADQAGNHGVPGKVDGVRAGGDGTVDGGDLAALDEDGLIFARRRACAIDDAHVSEGGGRRVEGEEGLQAGLESRGLLGCRERREEEKREGSHVRSARVNRYTSAPAPITPSAASDALGCQIRP